MKAKPLIIAGVAVSAAAALAYFLSQEAVSQASFRRAPPTQPQFGPASGGQVAPTQPPPPPNGPQGQAPGVPHTPVGPGPPCLGITDPNVWSACLTAENLTPAQWEEMVRAAQGEPPAQATEAAAPGGSGPGLLGALPGGGLLGALPNTSLGALAAVSAPVLGVAIPVAAPVLSATASFARNAVGDAVKNPVDFSTRQLQHIGRFGINAGSTLADVGKNIIGSAGGALGGAGGALGGAARAVSSAMPW